MLIEHVSVDPVGSFYLPRRSSLECSREPLLLYGEVDLEIIRLLIIAGVESYLQLLGISFCLDAPQETEVFLLWDCLW